MLDITSFSNALRDGNVSFLKPLGVRPFVDRDGAIVSFSGEDAVVFPLVREGNDPQFAVRLPLEPTAGRRWPAQYADLAGAVGAIQAHLPQELTILDVDDVPGTWVALLYDWVPGETITTRVTRARERVARDRLSDLLWPLADVAEALRVSGVDHGDISPGNLVIRPDGNVVLIDLDRMSYRGSGTGAEPRRRAGYRLPRAGGTPAEEDAFALLVLMASCGILADANLPAEHERASESSHPMLLFSSWDLMDPQRSRLVRDIEPHLSPASRELLELLFAACNGRPERLPDLVRDAARMVRKLGAKPDPDPSAQATPTGWRPVGAPASRSHSPVSDNRRAPRVARRPAPSGSWRVEPEPASSAPGDQGAWPAITEPAKTPPASPGSRGREQSTSELLASLQSITASIELSGGSSRRQIRAEQRRQRVSEQLRSGLSANDRAVLVDLAMSGALAELGDSDRDDVVQVVRALAHDSLTRAIASDNDERIVAAVDESVFAQDSDIDPEFRDRVRLARDRERWIGRVLAAVRERDSHMCATLLGDAPAGGSDRLSEPVRRQAVRLAALHEAASAAQDAIRERDANRLAGALGRLVAVRPAWTDEVDASAVVALLGEEQIERRLVSLFEGRTLRDEDQWMVDIVIATGRLPEVTRLAGLSPRDVDQLIYRSV